MQNGCRLIGQTANMKITRELLEEWEFRLTHICEQRPDGSVRFLKSPAGHQQTQDGREPMVYVWLSPEDGFLKAMYVGKAGLGVSQRLRQHENGFRHSGPGRKNFEQITRLLGEGKGLVVYARKSATTQILGVAGVNLYSAEEEAAHELLQPLWNRAEFATTRLKGDSAGDLDQFSKFPVR